MKINTVIPLLLYVRTLLEKKERKRNKGKEIKVDAMAVAFLDLYRGARVLLMMMCCVLWFVVLRVCAHAVAYCCCWCSTCATSGA